MLSTLSLVFGAVFASLSPTSTPRATRATMQTEFAKLSPFEMVRWNGDVPEVLLRGAWWRLEAIDSVTRESLLAESRRLYRDKWAKRFCEDLVELMTLTGHPPKSTCELRLVDLADGTVSTLKDVAWSADNRRRIRDARPLPGADGSNEATAVLRIERKRATVVPAHFEALVRRIDALESRGELLARAQAADDLAQLEWLVEHTYSYRDRAGFDHRAAFDALHARLPDAISRASFALSVHRLLCGFGDGHTRVRVATAELFVPGVLPFALVRDAHGVVALMDGGTRTFDDDHPYLIAIDGEPLATWLDAARELVPRGSKAFEDRSALRRVVHVPHLRAERGRSSSDVTRIRLANSAGKHVDREVGFATAPSRAADGELLSASRLQGDIGYLRIASMEDDPKFLASLERHLDELAGVSGLVVDVRGNGGGSRKPLLTIAPRIMPIGIDALVVNVAALRLAPGEDAIAAGAALADRFLFAADWSGWSPAARAAVTKFDRAFSPQKPLAPNEFTRWHYLVLERDAKRKSITGGRVIVLCDQDCFSATDIFLGALAELPNVTLVGQPSGGGSGRARGHKLAHSGLEVQLSTMASFLPDGSPYDGRGIQPDIAVEPTLEDLLARTDSTLERAVELVRNK